MTVRQEALAVLLPGFAGPEAPAWLLDALRDGLAGVCLFASNLADPPALTASLRAVAPHAVIAIDEEGGDVTRLHTATGSPEPGNAVLGRIGDEAATAASARRIGTGLAAAGITLDLAPVVDANTNPDNPVIGTRSFGADAALVARHGAAWIRGLQSTGVAACAKHFPGHGDTAVDSHLGLPVVDRDLDALRRRELLPFVAAIDAGVAAVMTSHILLPRLDPDAPATLSRAILTSLLRDELGFGGVIVTDALDMAGASGTIGIPEAAVRALVAGADLLCLGTDSASYLADSVAAVVGAVADGRLPAARLREAGERVRRLAAPAVPVAAAFDVQPAAAALLRARTGWTLVRLSTRANAAVGAVAWGRLPISPAVDLDLDVDAGVRAPEITGPVLVVGRDLHRHPHARAVVDALRDRGPTVVVDMGWPSPDRRYADVATFGASCAVTDALTALIREGA